MARQRKQISEAQRRIILERYDAGEGMTIIGATWGHCTSTIRRLLIENGRTVRPVGHPKKQ